MKIKIIGSCNKMVWYSAIIGKVFDVWEIDSRKAARVKYGNKINSAWVKKEDYTII